MSITAVGPLWIPTQPSYDQMAGTFSDGFVGIDAATEKYAVIFRAPKDGTLDLAEIGFIGSVGNNPDNGLRVSFQDVDLTTGFPDGTQDQYRDITGTITSNAWQTPGLMTSDGTDTGTKRTVAAGDAVAVVVEFASFVASDSVNIRVQAAGPNGPFTSGGQCYGAFYNGAAWAKNVHIAPFAVKYSDGSYAYLAPQWYPVSSLTTQSVATNTTPDEVALRFQVPVSMRLVGMWFRYTVSGNVDAVLYDASDVVLYSQTIDTDAVSASGNIYVPTDALTLTANTIYRASFKPTTTTAASIYNFNVPSNAHLAAVEGGIEWYYSERTDAGAWTDTTTRRPWIGLVFDGVDASAAGGAASSSSATLSKSIRG